MTTTAPVATIILRDGANGVFVATTVSEDDHRVTARGRYCKQYIVAGRPQPEFRAEVQRTWSRRQIREIRWTHEGVVA